jgi:endonuclease/exonuclease/phosphatase family metal-dependent hydrolase
MHRWGMTTSFFPVIGKNGLHQETSSGERLINFASSKGLVIASTVFEHKEVHFRTWKSPGKLTFTQIDHVLTDRRHVSDLLDVRTCRGADINSDHFLVLTLIRSRISNPKSLMEIKV